MARFCIISGRLIKCARGAEPSVFLHKYKSEISFLLSGWLSLAANLGKTHGWI